MMRLRIVVSLLFVLGVLWGGVEAPAQTGAPGQVDLSKCRIVAQTSAARQLTFATMVQEEIEARTGLKPTIASSSGNGAEIIIALADGPLAQKLQGGPELPEKAESYAVWVDQTGGAAKVCVLGRDDRGTLFGAGKVLRSLYMADGALTVSGGLREATAPVYAMRGHQIGYRNTANSYDAWDTEQYEQYIRELAMFGANAIEMTGTTDPEERDSVHMLMSIWDMTIEVSKICDAYDVDFWAWVPLDGYVDDPKVYREELEKRRKYYSECPRVDHVMVPGGDPGHTEPHILLPWLEDMTAILHEYHPDAEVWVSNQGFTHEENEVFFTYLRENDCSWLGGLVFGPWTKISIKEMRERMPESLPLRRYPDITHCLRCQYPMPQWDPAFAHTLGREPCNPRPIGTALIHNIFDEYSCGFVSYSDGVHDDANKVIWSALGWNPDASVEDILEEYGRLFVGPEQAKAVSEGLYALEQNWIGPAAENEGIEKTLEHWQAIEQAAPEAVENSWRFQLHLLRAYYDTYVQRRLARETAREEKALDWLSKARKVGIPTALAGARSSLAEQDTDPAIIDPRLRIEKLGIDLYRTIGMQLDVKRYRARNAERGAVLEFLDTPLNDRAWLEIQFAAVEELPGWAEQLEVIDTIVNWEDAGPGGFYDDLGHIGKEPHLVREGTWKEDPGFVNIVQNEFAKGEGLRLSWMDQAQTLFGTPLRMRYDNLDAGAQYKLRVTYDGRYRATMRLVADGQYEVHAPLPQPEPPAPVEFDIPAAATRDGKLELEWQLIDGRGCQVAETWLIKK